MIKIAVIAAEPSLVIPAQRLAKQINLPYLDAAQNNYDYFLILSPEGIALKKNDPQFQPFYIDFLSGPLAYRQKQASLRKESLARAIGIAPKKNPIIVDATAGLGRDSFILATLGYQVTMLERSPIIFTLLEDAMHRAQKDLSTIIARMHLIQADACTWLEQYGDTLKPNVIYIDPMFPERRKTAAIKKDMQIMQDIVHLQEDGAKLLEISRKYATQRVIVKRPKLADPINNQEPSFQTTGTSSRFDIYLCHPEHRIG